MTLANLREFRLFYFEPSRCIVARSTSVGRRSGIPEGVVLVGLHAHGMAARRDRGSGRIT